MRGAAPGLYELGCKLDKNDHTIDQDPCSGRDDEAREGTPRAGINRRHMDHLCATPDVAKALTALRLGHLVSSHETKEESVPQVCDAPLERTHQRCWRAIFRDDCQPTEALAHGASMDALSQRVHREASNARCNEPKWAGH